MNSDTIITILGVVILIPIITAALTITTDMIKDLITPKKRDTK
jgi:hypothetical protein